MNDARGPRLRHPFVIALTAMLFLQCAALVGATVFLIIELITARPSSYLSGLSLAVLTGIAAVWVAVVAVNVLRGSPWVRSAVVVLQVLQVAVAIGAFQGAFARPDVGWLLLLPAIATLVLLFTKPVLAFTARRDDSPPPEL